MENSIPILINIEKPNIISHSDLLNKIHKDIVFWGLNKQVPCSRTKRKCNNNVDINDHGQWELEADTNFSSFNRNAVVDNLQHNNIVSKIEVIVQNQQRIQLDNTCLPFWVKATKNNT